MDPPVEEKQNFVGKQQQLLASALPSSNIRNNNTIDHDRRRNLRASR